MDLQDYRVAWVHGVSDYKPGYSAVWTKIFNQYLNLPDPATDFIEVYWRGVFTAMTLAPRQPMNEAELVQAVQKRAEVHQALATSLLARAGANQALLPPLLLNPEAVVGEFIQYLLDENIRAAVKEKMKEKLRLLVGQGLNISIIAHSWGTVVAYESLIDLQQELPALQVTNLFTLGSPLWLVRSLLNDPSGHKPGNIAKWVNIYASGDFIAYSLYPDFQDDEDDEVPDFSNGADTHNSYFLNGNVAVQRDIVAANIIAQST